MKKETQKYVAFGFGVVFIVVLLLIAICFPNPTLFQYTVFRIVLALAAAGAAAMIPGFIRAAVGDHIRAGGALAVFVIVYFANPASLVSEKYAAYVDTVHDKNKQTLTEIMKGKSPEEVKQKQAELDQSKEKLSTEIQKGDQMAAAQARQEYNAKLDQIEQEAKPADAPPTKGGGGSGTINGKLWRVMDKNKDL